MLLGGLQYRLDAVDLGGEGRDYYPAFSLHYFHERLFYFRLTMLYSRHILAVGAFVHQKKYAFFSNFFQACNVELLAVHRLFFKTPVTGIDDRTDGSLDDYGRTIRYRVVDPDQFNRKRIAQFDALVGIRIKDIQV